MAHEGMYRGDLVEAGSPSVMLAMLDEAGAMAGLPFTPRIGRLLRAWVQSEPARGQSLRQPNPAI